MTEKENARATIRDLIAEVRDTKDRPESAWIEYSERCRRQIRAIWADRHGWKNNALRRFITGS